MILLILGYGFPHIRWLHWWQPIIVVATKNMLYVRFEDLMAGKLSTMMFWVVETF
jgi:hypothetical protein